MGVLTEPSLSGPVTVNNTVPISKVGTITPGLIGSAEIPARTTFSAVSGAYGCEASTGNVGTFTINPTSLVLLNKKGQYFPNYVDPLSGKSAMNIRTDWTKIGTRRWNGRTSYIKKYNSTYGNQSDAWWNIREIHHIRPRAYGGSDDFSNLMPVTKPQHVLITQWFANY